MKLKFTYGLTFGIFGVILGAIVAHSVVFLVFWVCATFLSIDVTCYFWQTVIFPSIFIITFLIILIHLIRKGIKYGSTFEDEEDDVILKAKAKKMLIIALIALFFGVSLLTKAMDNMRKKARLKNEQYAELVSRVKINALHLMNAGSDGVGVVVDLEGVKENKCELILDLSSYGHVKDSLLEVKGDLSLNNEKKQEAFYVPFSDIEKNYRRVLLKDIPAFNENKDMEEYIVFRVRLKLLEAEGYDAEEMLQLAPKEDIKSGAARFLFSCDRDKCSMIQEEKPAE